MRRCLATVALLLASNFAHSSLITTTKSGDLMFEYLRGEAGPSVQEFGLGTPNADSTLADRNMVFAIDYNRAVVPPPVVNKGYYWTGSSLDFYNLSDYLGNLFAFSSDLAASPTAADRAVFTDTDNSLGLGGSVIETIGDNDWILHLDDAWSYRFDDDDNELVLRVWVDTSAAAPFRSQGRCYSLAQGCFLH